jgi:hypothetical protein
MKLTRQKDTGNSQAFVRWISLNDAVDDLSEDNFRGKYRNGIHYRSHFYVNCIVSANTLSSNVL